jgi:GT2 family glycosyltransferase
MKNISFVTNCSVNTRDHLELLLRSLHDNLDDKNHEVLVFIDSDNEGIREYLRTIKHQFVDLKVVTHKINPCTGYALNNNILVDLAKYDIVSYLQSDMVIGPHYDTYILNELEENMILSATRVEPPLHGYSDYTITYDLGTDPLEFDMEKWNAYSAIVKTSQEAEYFFAPITFYKKVWQDLGGYDTQFRRSREDSDLVQRAMHLGIKLLQTWQANVYHFSCVSSRGKKWFDKSNTYAQERNVLQSQADQIELRRFLRKWGSFNHGQSKLRKYDVDLVITTNQDPSDANVNGIMFLEPYVSRVWLDCGCFMRSLHTRKNAEHQLANKLFNFTETDWNNASKYYNNDANYHDICKLGLPSSYNVKITIDDLHNPDNAEFYNNMHNLHLILENQREGVWQLGAVTIDIQKLELVSTQFKVTNPTIDRELLVIE